MKIAVLVSNDLSFDQRVRKTCKVFVDAGHEPILVGRLLSDSKPYDGPGSAVRFALKRSSGMFFYAELQWALWKWLKGADIDAVWANDLDTLLPALLVSRRRKLRLVYDSHEYFTEAAGLTGRPLRRWVWLTIERYCIPKLKKMLTVNESIAKQYRSRYGIQVDVLRNMPVLTAVPELSHRKAFEEFKVPTDLPILLLQGAFMDRDRGTSDAVDALERMTDVRLVLVGAGIEFEESIKRMNDPRWSGRLHCIPRLPYEKLRLLTASADVGLSLDKGMHANYLLSLPNKLFDFIHVGLPVVASPMVEVRRVVEGNGVGVVIEDVTTDAISSGVLKVLSSPREMWFEKCMAARKNLHWGTDSFLILEHLKG
ncbi:MAG: glycosyltransferase [Bacteroidetes bacterium]|nr:glycosyltransferase [Bacteroidota bacterium]